MPDIYTHLNSHVLGSLLSIVLTRLQLRMILRTASVFRSTMRKPFAILRDRSLYERTIDILRLESPTTANSASTITTARATEFGLLRVSSYNHYMLGLRGQSP
jgi:hypothetical protein